MCLDFLLLILFCGITALTASLDLDIAINSNVPIATVDENFLSLTLDAHEIITNFSQIQFTSDKLIALSKGLGSNVHLRFGGSTADRIRFKSGSIGTGGYDEDDLGDGYDLGNHDGGYVLTGKELDSMCEYVRKLGWTFVFGLNVMIRKPDGSWDPKNAIKLIKYLESKKLPAMHYELGNEPDLLPYYLNKTIPPQQLADDFKSLHAILQDLTSGKSKLIGPDEGPFIAPGSYFEKFLSRVSGLSLDVISFHHYYSSSQHISVRNFTDVLYLDSFLDHAMQALHVVKKTLPHKPVWIGETSSTFGHGSLIGQSYAASFLWLDKLGLAAQMNISLVARQTLKGPQYSLLDADYNPTPDYWVSLVHKKIMGTRVLDISGALTYGRKMRVYAHCVRESFKEVDARVALMFLNIDVRESVRLWTPECRRSGGSVRGNIYLFRPVNGRLDDKLVTLNGKILRMIDDNTLPELVPTAVKCPYVIPPLTHGFLLLKNDFDTPLNKFCV